MDRASLGTLGEDAAAAFLRERGFAIVGRNVRVGRLELDLIAQRFDLLVFCEVKTRVTEDYGSPVEAIDAAKVRRVQRAAYGWLRDKGWRPRTIRFDACGVLVRPGQALEIQYYEDAF